MRQLHVLARRASARKIVEIAKRQGATALSELDGRSAKSGDTTLILLTLPNDSVGAFVEAASEAGAIEVSFIPAGALIIDEPLDRVAEAVRRVEIRSPIELLLGSFQSLGGWAGLLTYSILSGVVAAYAVLFNLTFLLVAAMLIAPVGAPAMVAVVGTAVGDRWMIGRGALRFFVSIGTLALAAITLGLLYGAEVSTPTMETISTLSIWTGVLAVVGGAAGASAQMRSERDSLVTGTATGFLIAVGLSPPASVLGLSIAIGRWDYFAQMAFILLTTFAGILVGGTITLAAHGLRPGSTALRPGSAPVRAWALGLAAVVFAAAVGWQSTRGPSFLKADLSTRAVQVTRDAVGEVDRARLLEANARFTRQDLPNVTEEALYVQVLVEPIGVPAVVIRDEVRQRVGSALRAELDGVIPYVDVTVLSGAR